MPLCRACPDQRIFLSAAQEPADGRLAARPAGAVRERVRPGRRRRHVGYVQVDGRVQRAVRRTGRVPRIVLPAQRADHRHRRRHVQVRAVGRTVLQELDVVGMGQGPVPVGRPAAVALGRPGRLGAVGEPRLVLGQGPGGGAAAAEAAGGPERPERLRARSGGHQVGRDRRQGRPAAAAAAAVQVHDRRRRSETVQSADAAAGGRARIRSQATAKTGAVRSGVHADTADTAARPFRRTSAAVRPLRTTISAAAAAVVHAKRPKSTVQRVSANFCV